MTGLPIITAAQRASLRGGVKGLLVGRSGIGKTSQLLTLDPASTLFIDLEAGDLAVAAWQGDTVRPRTWYDCRDLACWLVGPNPAMRADQPYSQAHYDYVRTSYGDPKAAEKYATLFIDSITVASRICLDWAQGEPMAFSDKTGKPDIRAAYGILAREMLAWTHHLQHARGKTVWMVCLLDDRPDEYGRPQMALQLEGRKSGADLPAIVDVIVTMLPDTDGGRLFVCSPVNDWHAPGKDRSGYLEAIEPANLGKLTEKLNTHMKRQF